MTRGTRTVCGKRIEESAPNLQTDVYAVFLTLLAYTVFWLAQQTRCGSAGSGVSAGLGEEVEVAEQSEVAEQHSTSGVPVV